MKRKRKTLVSELEPKKRSNRLLANKKEELENEKDKGNEWKSRAGNIKHTFAWELCLSITILVSTRGILYSILIAF
jgi:hypothetical protein